MPNVWVKLAAGAGHLRCHLLASSMVASMLHLISKIQLQMLWSATCLRLSGWPSRICRTCLESTTGKRQSVALSTIFPPNCCMHEADIAASVAVKMSMSYVPGLAASGLTAVWCSKGLCGPCSCTAALPCTQMGLLHGRLPCFYVPDRVHCPLSLQAGNLLPDPSAAGPAVSCKGS